MDSSDTSAQLLPCLRRRDPLWRGSGTSVHVKYILAGWAEGRTVESQGRFSKVHKHLKIQTEAHPAFQITLTGQVHSCYW